MINDPPEWEPRGKIQTAPGLPVRWESITERAADVYEANNVEGHLFAMRAALLSVFDTDRDEVWETIHSAVQSGMREDVDDPALSVTRAVMGAFMAMAEAHSETE